mmetsp:Transcript_25926/g.42381  ORF Transcript_25926/g.42381 Transcript_25926/m.42381 type:complete len:209 (-) Transcript_25926:1151-1777(-)
MMTIAMAVMSWYADVSWHRIFGIDVDNRFLFFLHFIQRSRYLRRCLRHQSSSGSGCHWYLQSESVRFTAIASILQLLIEAWSNTRGCRHRSGVCMNIDTDLTHLRTSSRRWNTCLAIVGPIIALIAVTSLILLRRDWQHSGLNLEIAIAIAIVTTWQSWRILRSRRCGFPNVALQCVVKPALYRFLFRQHIGGNRLRQDRVMMRNQRL